MAGAVARRARAHRARRLCASGYPAPPPPPQKQSRRPHCADRNTLRHSRTSVDAVTGRAPLPARAALCAQPRRHAPCRFRLRGGPGAAPKRRRRRGGSRPPPACAEVPEASAPCSRLPRGGPARVSQGGRPRRGAPRRRRRRGGREGTSGSAALHREALGRSCAPVPGSPRAPPCAGNSAASPPLTQWQSMQPRRAATPCPQPQPRWRARPTGRARAQPCAPPSPTPLVARRVLLLDGTHVARRVAAAAIRVVAGRAGAPRCIEGLTAAAAPS